MQSYFFPNTKELVWASQGRCIWESVGEATPLQWRLMMIISNQHLWSESGFGDECYGFLNICWPGGIWNCFLLTNVTRANAQKQKEKGQRHFFQTAPLIDV